MTEAQIPIILAQPTNEVVLAGGAASFSVAVSGTGPLTYQWQFNGVDLPGATGSSLILTNVQVRQSGAYSVAVTGPAGVAQSPNAAVFVTQAAVWGLDSQANVPGTLTNVVAVAGGIFHTLVLKADGTVVGWGFSDYTDYGPLECRGHRRRGISLPGVKS